MARRLVCAALACVAMLCTAAIAAAESTPIATVAAQTPISAGDGWLVWSVSSHGGWILDAYHDGEVEALPVKPRPEPFDVNIGTNSSRAPVATFSRCRQTPKMYAVGAQQAGGLLTKPSTGAGCHIYEFNLQTGRERAVAIPHPAGTSDTTPSMWHGNIAFARTEPTHPKISEVVLYSSNGNKHELITLHHGAVPSPCPKKTCGDRTILGEVQALDFDAQAVAFVWQIEGPGVVGDAAWEDRVDDLSTDTGNLAGSAILTESCAGGGADEESWPSPPVLAGTTAFFSELRRGALWLWFDQVRPRN
jgi:hypothetical protein